MKILVTGGAGFVGSHLVDRLLQLGHEVIVVDNLATGYRHNLNPRARFYEVSLLDESLGEIFQIEKPDIVNHHAAQNDVRRSSADPVFDAQHNIIGSIRLIQCCIEHNVQKVIYASSGGTDITNFYQRHGGEVISTAINKYISVRITGQRNHQIAVSTPHHCETGSALDQIQHPLIREAMRKTGVTCGISVTVIADVTSRGCGLGSSSALTVGLLNALYAYRRIEMPAETLAHQACEIEIDHLNQPIGKQDQYIAAYGGLRWIQFNRYGSVQTQDIPTTAETLAHLEQNLMLFYTGIQRRAETILHEQKRAANPQTLLQMRELVPTFYDALVNGNTEACLNEIGHLLHRTWQLKRSLCESISNSMLDTIYERAVTAGALGGKILGAGGGGYFLFYVPKEKQQAVTATLSALGLSQSTFHFEPKGSQIIAGRNLDESHYPYRGEWHTTQTPHVHFP